jgi:hypothetical protein
MIGAVQYHCSNSTLKIHGFFYRNIHNQARRVPGHPGLVSVKSEVLLYDTATVFAEQQGSTGLKSLSKDSIR